MCTPTEWLFEWNKLWSECINVFLSTGLKVAKNRVPSWSRMFGLGAFTIFAANQGPQGWDSAYSIDEAERRLRCHGTDAEDAGDETKVFQRENAIRLHIVMKGLLSVDVKFELTCKNPTSKPSEKLLRLMDRVDAVANRESEGHIALIYLVTAQDEGQNATAI